MRPDRNPEIFETFAKDMVSGMANEFERTQRAQIVLGRLSEEFSEMPVTSPIAEPTMAAKMHVLSRLQVDPMGIAGFNPMTVVGLDENGVSMQAIAAPAHDQHEIIAHNKKIAIKTRAILIKPVISPKPKLFMDTPAPEDKESELEFFGLNVYPVSAEQDTELDEAKLREVLEATQPKSSDITLSPAAKRVLQDQQRLVIAKGEPLHGITNIFAVRHKEHGIVKLYGISLMIDPFSAVPTQNRESKQLLSVSLPLPNDMLAKITVLEDQQFDEALNEFDQATEAIRISKTLDPANSRFSIVESHALRAIMAGNVETDSSTESDRE